MTAPAERSRRSPAWTRVLETDPELGLRVPADRITRARQVLVASVHALEPGLWEPPLNGGGAGGHMGYLILDGLLARNIVLAGSVCTELLGDGDVVQPTVARDERLVHYHVAWHVLEPVRFAALDDGFARRLVEWPQVTAALLERAIRRTHRMAVHQSLLQLSPVESRLLVLFWHLAERWGRVTSGGIVLSLRLPHQLLGQLVGCQRSSVTTALKEIEANGLATRRTDGTWLLRGNPPDELSELRWHHGQTTASGAQPAHSQLAPPGAQHARG